MRCHNRRCNKDIEYGSDEACIYEDEIYCSDSCMLPYVEYGVPNYMSYSEDEWDEADSWSDAKDGTKVTR